jgi:hypothetical protein
MSRPLRRSELRAARGAISDGQGCREGSAWSAIHDRLLCADITRRQYLDEVIAAEKAAIDQRNQYERERRRRIALRGAEVPTDG